MDGAETLTTTTLVTVHCGNCHMAFGMPQHFYRQCKDTGAWFRCPNPECAWPKQRYGESELQKTQKLLESAQRHSAWNREVADQERAARHATERRLAATKGVVTRTKRRIGNGVCPCCNRTFAQLARHMAGQHPEYAHDAERAT